MTGVSTHNVSETWSRDWDEKDGWMDGVNGEDERVITDFLSILSKLPEAEVVTWSVVALSWLLCLLMSMRVGLREVANREESILPLLLLPPIIKVPPILLLPPILKVPPILRALPPLPSATPTLLLKAITLLL